MTGSHLVNPERSRTVAIPTSQQSSSNVTGDAHQQLPFFNMTVTREPLPHPLTSHTQMSGSMGYPPTRPQHNGHQPTSPSVFSNHAGQSPPRKRTRLTGTGEILSETATLPPRAISDSLVRGAENCLSGCVFIFSGHLPNLSRAQARKLVKSHGGRIVLDPDEFTTHFVLGQGASKEKIAILNRFQIVPLDEQGLIQMVQEMPTNGHYGTRPIRDDQCEPATIGRRNMMVGPAEQTVDWPFDEPPNLVRHVPRALEAQQIETTVKDESIEARSVVDGPPRINHALRKEFAKSWKMPKVRRGNLKKMRFAVNYEKGESRLVKHEVRRRGGKIVRISQADVLVVDRHSFSAANFQATMRYRPEWQIQSDKFFEAFPVLEVLPFGVDRETNSATAGPSGPPQFNVAPSRAAGNVESTAAPMGSSRLEQPLRRAVGAQDRSLPFQPAGSCIAQAQAKYEDLIAQRNAYVAVRDRELRKAERRGWNFYDGDVYDSDSDEIRDIEQDTNNEEHSFRPPSPAVPAIMEEVASDGYASSCDEHEIHRAIIHSTKRMKPAKVKKGFLIQVKMVMRGPNGATVNAVNGRPGVTRTLRVPAVTSFRQLTDILNTA